ncbi:MAG TPA: DUF4199 domain-containing protein [Pseudoxanthomonas sp.]|nr:DUF4199 domain-containing protein [Pseudoxanthomonas sp.]
MLKKMFAYGAIAGLIAGGVLSALVLAPGEHGATGATGMLVGYLTMLVGLSLVFVAIKRHRDDALGGTIRFWPAFALGLGISFVASVIYALAWEAALAISGLDFAGSYANSIIEQQKAKGVSGEALAKLVAEMEQFKASYANPAYRLPMTFTEIFPVGVIVSLVSAAVLRNPRVLPARRG